MILKASQRAGANQLAAHLLNDRDNDHVTLHELRGFVADDLQGALSEAYAVSRGTKCKQCLFSLSLNPPKEAVAKEEDFERAANEAEKRLGLSGQPRAIVLHEKEGRRHAHVVWSRIDANAMRAVNMAHFKRKLTTLSRELFLEHGWSLPEGLRSFGGRSPLNFTLAEWQQAKRQGVDPREIKDALRDAWDRSDSQRALKAALEDRGYFLAKGDRRGVVVLDTEGTIYSFARWSGVATRDVRERLGDPDSLPSVEEARARLRSQSGEQMKSFLRDLRLRQAEKVAEQRGTVAALVRGQRSERATLAREQAARWQDETASRAARMRKGLAGLWDTVTGRRATLRKQNKAEATAALARDRTQRDALVVRHLSQRQTLQETLDQLRAKQVQERRVTMRAAIEQLRRLSQREGADRAPTDNPSRAHSHSFDR